MAAAAEHNSSYDSSRLILGIHKRSDNFRAAAVEMAKLTRMTRHCRCGSSSTNYSKGSVPGPAGSGLCLGEGDGQTRPISTKNPMAPQLSLLRLGAGQSRQRSADVFVPERGAAHCRQRLGNPDLLYLFPSCMFALCSQSLALTVRPNNRLRTWTSRRVRHRRGIFSAIKTAWG